MGLLALPGTSCSSHSLQHDALHLHSLFSTAHAAVSLYNCAWSAVHAAAIGHSCWDCHQFGEYSVYIGNRMLLRHAVRHQSQEWIVALSLCRLQPRRDCSNLKQRTSSYAKQLQSAAKHWHRLDISLTATYSALPQCSKEHLKVRAMARKRVLLNQMKQETVPTSSLGSHI